jgi:hypothetical protein
MTIYQLNLYSVFYLVVTIVVALLTRATPTRIAGSLAGAAAAGLLATGIVVFGERVGLWHMVIPGDPYFLTMFAIDFILCAFLFLITWRIARRFGPRGLAVVLVFVAIIGPPRDYAVMRRFPEWGSYAPGLAPILAVSVSYVLFILAGHATMRLIAGPARADRLARRPWEPR